MAIDCPRCGHSAWKDVRGNLGKLYKECANCTHTRLPVKRKAVGRAAALPGPDEQLKALVKNGMTPPKVGLPPPAVCNCGGMAGHVPYGMYCRRSG